MDLAPRRFADTLVLSPGGRIDHANAEALKAALAPFMERCAAGQDHLVLDLSGVEYISSAGLRVLMLARKQAKAQGGDLVVAALPPIVMEIFEISRFTVVFEVFSSVRDAVARVSPAVKAKLIAALVKASGRTLDTPDKARAFVERELDFAVSHTFGGNSSCVEIEAGGPEYVLCDLGSGARAFGNRVLATRGTTGNTFHVFMSHVHWDHIMGFPFFMPAYIPGNRVRIYGAHDVLEEAFRRQNRAPSFPVDFSRMGAAIEFVRLEPGRTYEIAGLAVRVKLQRHGGDSYGYRLERDGKAVVYSTDSEHKLEDPAETEEFVEFFRDADLVIFDAMYSLAEAISVKEDWGHSSNIVGVELCQRARARHLCLYHHEPIFDDDTIASVLRETRRLEEITRDDHRVEISAAWDGMEITV